MSIFFVSLYLIYAGMKSQSEVWQNFGKDGQYKTISVCLFDKSDYEIYETLTNSAKENKVSLSKVDCNFLPNGSSEVRIYVFIANQEIDLFEKIRLL